jgi:hypothetical protein
MVVVEILNFALVAQLAMVGALDSIHVFMWKFTFALVSKTQLLEAMSCQRSCLKLCHVSAVA